MFNSGSIFQKLLFFIKSLLLNPFLLCFFSQSFLFQLFDIELAMQLSFGFAVKLLGGSDYDDADVLEQTDRDHSHDSVANV